MGTRSHTAAAVAALAMLLAACSDEAAGREVAIAAERDVCKPARITATPGERLLLRVENRSLGDRVLEGVEGTTFEKLETASGETRTGHFTMPATGGAKIACSAGAAVLTVIEVAPADAR